MTIDGNLEAAHQPKREFECDRKQHFWDVWKSCKTEEQERNCERWIARTAKPWPSDERDNIMEYIEEYKEVRSAIKWRPIKNRKPEKELIYKVADQEKRIKELELKFEALVKYVRKNIAKAKGEQG